jgi:osmoprotectant transport system ATP-binding protein
MIRLNQVTKSFGDRRVIDALSLQLATGQTHVLLGSSGSGKSTLLRLIAGLIEPDEGEIWVNADRMTPASQRALALRMGYVTQDGGLFPHLTVDKNVALVARTLGWPEERIRCRMLELSELAQLDSSLLARYPRQLSGGQRQRVSIMRALMLDPQLLLLDEPLGALDPIIRAGLRQELKRIFDSLRKTVVLVTHDMSEAAFFGSSVTLIRDGCVVQRGDFSELASHPASAFVTEFIHAQLPPQPLRALP